MIEYGIVVVSAICLLFIWKIYSLTKENMYLKDIAIEYHYKNDNSDSDMIQEQFIKFISDSREWAFEYIENVQSSIKNVVDFIEPSIQDSSKEYTDRELLNSVYKNLKSLLPEQDN